MDWTLRNENENGVCTIFMFIHPRVSSPCAVGINFSHEHGGIDRLCRGDVGQEMGTGPDMLSGIGKNNYGKGGKNKKIW